MLLLRLSLPLLVLVFCAAFFYHIADGPILSSILPRLLIAGLVALILFLVWSEIANHVRLRKQAPSTSNSGEDVPQVARSQWWTIVMLVAVLGMWIALLSQLGFLIASILVYIAASMVLMPLSPANLGKLLLAAALFVPFVMLLFDHFLGVPLPPGPWS